MDLGAMVKQARNSALIGDYDDARQQY